jgi:hypothetical protein
MRPMMRSWLQWHLKPEAAPQRQHWPRSRATPKSSVTVFAAAVLALSVAGPVASAEPVASAHPIAADPLADGQTGDSGVPLADALDFRATFGFSTDLDTVTATLNDPKADTTWGTPLTVEEAANMAERQRLFLQAETIEGFVDANPGTFGGVYYEQAAGSLVLYIASTPATSKQALAKALSLSPSGLQVKIVSVAHTMSELTTAEDQLVAKSDELGLKIVGIDTPRNSLVATLAPGSDARAPALVVDVPVAVTVGEGFRPASCWNNCTPWRGGMNVWDQAFPSDGNCTWGFYGSRGSSAKYVISAGHCGKAGHVLRIKDPSNNTIVFTDGIDENTFDFELDGISESDAQTAHVKSNANATTPFNRIIGSSSDLNHAITGIKNNSQNVGATVCFFGYKSHRASPCGTITIINLVVEVDRADDGKHLRLTNLREMSLPASGGDSGGPVYSGALAYGINTGIDTVRSNHLIYSMIANVQLNTGTNVCVSSAC